MFNQPRPLRPAKPWQASSYLRVSRQEQPFNAELWTQEDAPQFADSGMPTRSTGFAADTYQAMTQPLSAQAKKALALLDEEHSLEVFAQEKNAAQDGSSTNAHLPFVLDVYESVIGKKSQTAQAVTPAVAVATLQEATLPNDTLANQDTTAEAVLVDEALAPQAAPLSEAGLHETSGQAQAPDAEISPSLDTDTSVDSAKEAEQAEAAAQQDGEGEPENEPDVQAASVDLAEDEPAREPAPEPVDATPQAEGLDPEVAAQREAEKFAEGVAQGTAQGLEQGLAQGLAQGRAQGLAEGSAQAREAMAKELADQCALLAQVTHDLKALMADPKQFFEPLKRLSVHVAEQLVLGELSHSSQAIERLIQHCLDEVSHPLQDGVVVELNPDDKKRLQAQGGAFLEGLRLEAVPELHPGSVRVFANDMVVEDLVEHRLQALAKNLVVDVPGWQKNSVLAPPEPHTDKPEHDDDPA